MSKPSLEYMMNDELNIAENAMLNALSYIEAYQHRPNDYKTSMTDAELETKWTNIDYAIELINIFKKGDYNG